MRKTRALGLFAAIIVSSGLACAQAQTAPAASASSPEALQKQLEELRTLVVQLTSRINGLEEQLRPRDTATTLSPVPQPLALQPVSVKTGSSAWTIGTTSIIAGGTAAPSGPISERPVAAPPIEAKKTKAEPFAFADFTWLNGNARTKGTPYATKFFTPEIRADVDYIYDFNHPKDDTIGGSSEAFRSNEVHVTQLGVGGDFHYDNVRARLMTQFGLYSQTTPRNDASPARGQWNLDNAYRYVSEAYGGYHFNALHGINVDAGIFMSYIGLFSYYNFDNWAYQPSYVSSNTPWFFNLSLIHI